MGRKILLCLMLCLTLTGCGTGGSPETTEAALETKPFSLGRLEDGVYTSAYAGVGFRAGEDWEIQDAQELQDLPGGAAALSGDPLETLLKDFPYLRDMKATCHGIRSNVTVGYVRQDPSSWLAYQVVSDEQVVDRILEDQDQLALTYTQQGMTVRSAERIRADYCGREQWALKMVCDTDGGTLYMLQIFDYRLGSYGFTLSCTSLGEDHTQEVLDLFFPAE